MGFPFPQCPDSNTYIEPERDFAQPVPNNEPPGPRFIRWMTPSNYPCGSVWIMQILVFGPDERIFDRMTYEDNKVYWSQDTQTPLTREVTCASAGLHNNFRVFVMTREHSRTLDETA